VFCGDYSFDRGTGSVPAFLAHRIGAAQALGLVDVVLGAEPATASVLRRLDGGRRDRLTVVGPAVLSVEGSTAMLRRAPLRSLLARREVAVVTSASAPTHDAPAVSRPYRPRPRALPAPAGANALDRVRSLISAAGAAASSHGDPIVLDPDEAADRILAALVEWHYLDEP
jgi:electron transfer flavoprotein beta subunit